MNGLLTVCIAALVIAFGLLALTKLFRGGRAASLPYSARLTLRKRPVSAPSFSI